MGVPFAASSIELALAQWPRLHGDAVLQAGGSDLTAHADLEIRNGDGEVELSGALAPETLRSPQTGLA